MEAQTRPQITADNDPQFVKDNFHIPNMKNLLRKQQSEITNIHSSKNQCGSQQSGKKSF